MVAPPVRAPPALAGHGTVGAWPGPFRRPPRRRAIALRVAAAAGARPATRGHPKTESSSAFVTCPSHARDRLSRRRRRRTPWWPGGRAAVRGRSPRRTRRRCRTPVRRAGRAGDVDGDQLEVRLPRQRGQLRPFVRRGAVGIVLVVGWLEVGGLDQLVDLLPQRRQPSLGPPSGLAEVGSQGRTVCVPEATGAIRRRPVWALRPLVTDRDPPPRSPP